MTPFDAAYKRLNTSQKEAVDSIEGPVMVIAGPGTGKTTILTLRIANILKRTDTPPHGILAITYTDAGVRAMRSKLRDIIGDRAHEVRIHTFHSFASSIIAEYLDHFLHLQGLKPMTDVDQESLIRLIISDPTFASLRPAGKPEAYVPGIIRALDESKREALTPAMVRSFAADEIERIKNDESSISTRGATKGQLKAEAKEAIEKCERTKLFSNIYERYEELKLKAKQMDFNDLIIELLVALRNDELLLRLIQERFLYLHVDEHQDTNDAQNFIVALIAEFFETPNIFIVGDEKQAIYRFQGASVENFLLLQKRWPAMKVISLGTNYRSHQGILDASFGMIEKNYEGDEHRDLRVKLMSGGDDKPRPVAVATAENVPALELHMVSELKALMEREPKATAAIIVRRNRDLDRVIRLLESHGIPVSSERSVDIFAHPAGRLFFDLMEYLADPARTDALARTAAAGMWDLSLDEASAFARELRGSSSVGWEKRVPALAAIRRSMLSESPVGFLIHAASASGYVNVVAANPSHVHVWRGIVALAESLVREGGIHDPAELMRNMLAYRISAESRTVKVAVGAPDVPFTALTAHGSKGLEFDYVFIPYATEEAWVGRPRGASFILPKKQTPQGDIRDVRRLFYVALTRARKHALVLTAHEESDGRALSPLRFIEELGEGSVEHISLPRAGAEQLYEGTEVVKEGSVELAAMARRVLSEKGLSVTALNHFLECPNKFIYNSILKLPQAPSAASEKGTAMHEALARVWMHEDRAKGNLKAAIIEPIIIEAIKEFFTRSFLPKSEQEAVQAELITDAPAVAKALESHFAQQGKVFTETWVEGSYVGSYEKAEISIPIHGKLDAIVDTGPEVLVFDYKTRQALSLNAIRGETKSSDGGYFRQLIFYRLLMAADIRWKGKKVSPALVFVSPDEKGRCPTISLPITDEDLNRVRGEIQTLIDSVWSGAIGSAKCEDPDCEWCGLRAVGVY